MARARSGCTTTTCSSRSRGRRSARPWHQDQPYYNIDGAQTVSFWIPLDPVPRESTLEFVAGSHAPAPGTCPAASSTSGAGLRRGHVRGGARRRGRPRRVHDPRVGARAGDAVAFNMLTLHAAAGSPNRRRAFSVRLVGDDVRLAVRPHATSPTFPEIEACCRTATSSTIRCSRGCSRAGRVGRSQMHEREASETPTKGPRPRPGARARPI